MDCWQVVEANSGNAKKGIVLIYIPNAQTKNLVTAKHLSRIEKIVEAVGFSSHSSTFESVYG
jgi:hypothetical protein